MGDVQREFFAVPQPKHSASAEPAWKRAEANRRTRISREVPVQLRDWLHRVVRCHAHLLAVVRLYGNPSKAGGSSSVHGDTYAARAARGDRTLLYDAVGITADELLDVRREIEREMDAAPPTDAEPGSRDKVLIMEARAARGESIFLDRDRRM